VDRSLVDLERGETVNYQQHIGGKWHVSVTSGFRCVDIREFYWHPMLGMKARKIGIAIRLGEWSKLKEVVQQLHAKHPTVAEAIPCADQSDHFNQEGAFSCTECNPFHCTVGFDFQTESKSVA
jgi:hypothetical protein